MAWHAIDLANVRRRSGTNFISACMPWSLLRVVRCRGRQITPMGARTLKGLLLIKLMSCVTMWPALASLIIANTRWIGGVARGDYGRLTVTMTPWVLDLIWTSCVYMLWFDRVAMHARVHLARTCGLVHSGCSIVIYAKNPSN